MVPDVGKLWTIGNPAVSLGAHQPGCGAQSLDQALPVEGAVPAEDNGADAVLFRLWGVRVLQLVEVCLLYTSDAADE